MVLPFISFQVYAVRFWPDSKHIQHSMDVPGTWIAQPSTWFSAAHNSCSQLCNAILLQKLLCRVVHRCTELYTSCCRLVLDVELQVSLLVTHSVCSLFPLMDIIEEQLHWIASCLPFHAYAYYSQILLDRCNSPESVDGFCSKCSRVVSDFMVWEWILVGNPRMVGHKCLQIQSWTKYAEETLKSMVQWQLQQAIRFIRSLQKVQ